MLLTLSNFALQVGIGTRLNVLAFLRRGGVYTAVSKVQCILHWVCIVSLANLLFEERFFNFLIQIILIAERSKRR